MLMVHMLCLTKQSTAQYEVTSVNPVEKNITFPNLLPLPIFFLFNHISCNLPKTVHTMTEVHKIICSFHFKIEMCWCRKISM